VNCRRFCFWHRRSVVFLFVYEISLEPLSAFAPSSHGRRVWSFARTSLKVKVKGQDHRWQKPAFLGLSAPACGLCWVKHLLLFSCVFYSWEWSTEWCWAEFLRKICWITRSDVSGWHIINCVFFPELRWIQTVNIDKHINQLNR